MPPQTITANIEMEGVSRPFRLFDTTLCRQVCDEIFRGESYPLLSVECPIETILDIGANIGAASLYFAMQYPQANIIAMEPSRDCLKLLRENLAHVATAVVQPCGLSDRDGKATLFHGERDAVTNSMSRSTLNASESEQIDLRDAAAFVDELGCRVDLLKLDTEGQEVAILRRLASRLANITVIYVEYHSEPDRREIDQLLAPTHLLWRAKSEVPHRGELAYALPNRVPERYQRLQIT